MKKEIYVVFLIVLSFLLSSCITIVQSPKESATVETKQQEAVFQEKCEMSAGFSCEELKVEPNKIMIKFTNKLGYRITAGDVSSSTCKSESSEAGSFVDNFRTYVAILRDCKNGNVGDIFSETLSIPYWFEVGNKGERGDATATINTKIINWDTIPNNEYSHTIIETNTQTVQSIQKQLESDPSYTFGGGGSYYKSQCEWVWYALQTGELTINDQNRQDFLGYMEFCYGKRELPPLPQKIQVQTIQAQKTFNHQINIIEPKNTYKCNTIEVDKLTISNIAKCKVYNYCDKIDPYDLSVRKSASDAISQHPGSFSTSQIIDIYKWAKDNIFYQNIPLNDYAPYKPSETIYTKSGDCKNYAAVISSMIIAIGGTARIVAIGDCQHAFAEVFIGGQSELDSLVEEIKQQYQEDIKINVIKDSDGFWLILDGSGAHYPGTTEITKCLDSNIERFYSYSCISSNGKINKRKWI